MPNRFIQRKSRPLLSVVNGQTTAIGVDSDDDSLKFATDRDIAVLQRNNDLSVALIATSVSQNFFMADANYQVTDIRVVNSVAGVAGSTVQITKCTTTTAPASGTSLLVNGTIAAPLTLAGTANFVFTGTLTRTTADLKMASGDRLAVVLTGTLTNLVAVVQVLIKRIE